jgi:hypothetical protein
MNDPFATFVIIVPNCGSDNSKMMDPGLRPAEVGGYDASSTASRIVFLNFSMP